MNAYSPLPTRTAWMIVGLAFLLLTCGTGQAGEKKAEIKTLKELIARYSSKPCQECHAEIYGQWEKSQHARPLMGLQEDVFLTRALKNGPLAIKEGQKATRENLICAKCHLPQLLGASDAVADELARAILGGDKDTLRQLNIGCPVCHQDKAVVHGRPEKGVIYGSRDMPDHPGAPVRKSALLKDPLICGQCHGLGPVLEFEHPEQCATLYGSYLHAYIPSGGTQTCQDCHMKGRSHYLAPNFADRNETAALYRAALPLEVQALGYTFATGNNELVPKVVIKTRIANKAGHRIPDG